MSDRISTRPRVSTARADARRHARTPLDIVLNKYIRGQPHLCRAVNLSRGGMLLRKVFEPDVAHDAVTLEFQLPGSDEVLRAEGVALMDGKEARAVGVRFTQMSAAAASALELYLGARLGAAGAPTQRLGT